GLCIYAVSASLHGLIGCLLDDLQPSLRIPARILLGILAGAIGWFVGFVISALILTGHPLFSEAFGSEERALLAVALMITILFGGLAHGYEELRRPLADWCAQLRATTPAEKEH